MPMLWGQELTTQTNQSNANTFKARKSWFHNFNPYLTRRKFSKIHYLVNRRLKETKCGNRSIRTPVPLFQFQTSISGSPADFSIAQHAIGEVWSLELQFGFQTGKKVLDTLKFLCVARSLGLKARLSKLRSMIKKNWKLFVAFHCLNHSLQLSVSWMPPRNTLWILTSWSRIHALFC